MIHLTAFPVKIFAVILLVAVLQSCDFPAVRNLSKPVENWVRSLPIAEWKAKAESLAADAVQFLRSYRFGKAEGKKEPPKPVRTFRGKDTVIFKNGGKIQGNVIEKNSNSVRIEMDGGTVAFPRADISEIRMGETLVKDQSGVEGPAVKEKEDLPYPRLYLKNGNIVYGSSISKEEGMFYLKQEVEGGGNISYGFKPDEVEKMRLWKPPSEDEINVSFKDLRKLNMKYFIKKPPYYILSTVESSDAVLYFTALDRFYSDFLFYFFDLIDPGKSHGPLAVILFGSYENFLKVCNLPKDTYIAGFYAPDDRTLRLFNVKETAFVNYELKGAEYVGQQIGRAKKTIENLDSDKYDDKWQAYDYFEKMGHDIEKRRLRLENLARAWTIQTIRHEAGHQLMHAFGYTSSGHYSGAWFSEGFSDYIAPEDMGEVNQERLMFLKKEIEAGHSMMPLQYLLTFESGSGKESVHKLPSQYAVMAYAQSWAFVYFLMQRYEEPFMRYIAELKNQDKDFNAKKDILLLEKHLGKTLPELDGEFESFMKKLMDEKVDLKEYATYRFFNPLSLFPSPEKRS